MDLVSLGQIAGLGGIAIGAVVLLVRPLIAKVDKAKPEQLALLRLIAVGAFAIGVLGMVAWAGGGTHVTAGQGGYAAGRDMSGNTFTPAPAGVTAPPATTPAAKPP
jgi:hypothetical protein